MRLTICQFVQSVVALAIGVVVVLGNEARAQDDTSTGSDAKETAALQMKRMQHRASTLKVWIGDDTAKEAKLLPAALLRYSSPGGDGSTADGTVWAWEITGRPVALAAIFFERLPEGQKWSCELLALADEPVSLASPAGWKWTPKESAARFKPVPGSTAVAKDAATRMRQMKELARGFTASETFDGNRTDQLRLMITPLHRYSDADNGLVDGALFAFASGTNPEALLLLEAIRDEQGEVAWHFGFARMGAAMCQAKRNDTVVWRCSAVDVWDNSETYYSMFGTQAAVFGEVSQND